MFKNLPFKQLVIVILFSTTFTQAADNPHFYRATNFSLEPRIEHDFLSTFDFSLGGGSTHTSRDKQGTKVPLFDIYGINSVSIPNTGTKIDVSIDGTFDIKEANLTFTQNFLRGFFLLLHLPVRNLHLHKITINALDQNIQSNSIKKNLVSQGLNPASSNTTGAGDFTTMIGWTHNYQNTTTLDFVDFTFGTGFLAPTGKKKQPADIFSLPLGYNGHWGIPLTGRLSLGMCEWITIGTAFNSLFFLKNNQTLGLKTSTQQTGIIFPTMYQASVRKGFIWDAGMFLKADHFMYGLSFTTGYSCAGEQKTKITPINAPDISKKIIRSDERFKKWYMHTLHLIGEYDFTRHDAKMGPRINLFYNYQFGGIRTFNTSMVGGSFGLDIAWDL